MRTLLVDDERPARERLRQLLEPLTEVEIVGEAEDGEQALERILELRPDLVLLDIQMPGCSGMELVASLPSPRPAVIFCTAYDRYAVDAFELHAVDYLLKPVNRSRLASAVARARRWTAEERESSLEAASRSIAPYPARFLARRGNRHRVVPADRVVCFTTEEGLTLLRTKEDRFWMQPSLAELERRLDPARFYRVSRSAIVNLDAVREVIASGGGQGEVLLRDGSTLEVSRRRYRGLLEQIEGA
jgi:two-component system LytT family response regulator